MNTLDDAQRWEASNTAYLSAALDWLRLRLVGLTQQVRPDAPMVTTMAPRPKEEKSRWNPFWRSTAAGDPAQVAAVPLALLAATPETVQQASLDEAAARMAEAAASDPPPALVLLGQRLGLSQFEQEILLLTVAMELDTRTAGLCATAQDSMAGPHPTFALAFALFDDPAWEALSPERPLRYFRLLEISQPGAQPLMKSALRADERILSYVKGLSYLDDRFAYLLTPVPPAVSVPTSQRPAVDAILKIVSGTKTGPRVPPLVRLGGPDAASKRHVAATVCTQLGVHLYRLPAEHLPTHAGELESLARLWSRETLLLPLALYIDAHSQEKGSSTESALQQAVRFAMRTGGLVFLDPGPAAIPSAEASVTIEVRKPTPTEQRAAWAAALGGQAEHAPGLLAGQFNLNLRDISEIAASVGQAGDGDDGTMRERLWRECLTKTRPGLDMLAEHIEATATWDDIVLPELEAALLRQVAGQVTARAQVYDDWGFRARMNRGLGITALFAGDSGTGKTMAAEVLANALQLDLYRIDLSAVVSKYIGETEKNLRRVFDAAEDGGAILFFDEADALFGKRSEVRDSHDRYANIEINYLLQRMEAYRGLAILATNMKSALDVAFMRRLRFIVNFPYPGLLERRAIWQHAFPAAVPTRGLDHDRLAKLNLTGGNIHNIALNAAFLAAQAGTSVTMPLVLQAARTELKKLDRPVNEADLRWVEPTGVAA